MLGTLEDELRDSSRHKLGPCRPQLCPEAQKAQVSQANLGSKLGAAEASIWFTYFSPAGRSQHYLMRTPNESTELLNPAVIHPLICPSNYSCIHLCQMCASVHQVMPDAKDTVGNKARSWLAWCLQARGNTGGPLNPSPAFGLEERFSNLNVHGNQLLKMQILTEWIWGGPEILHIWSAFGRNSGCMSLDHFELQENQPYIRCLQVSFTLLDAQHFLSRTSVRE